MLSFSNVVDCLYYYTWEGSRICVYNLLYRTIEFLITTQAKFNLSSRSGIGGVLSAT